MTAITAITAQNTVGVRAIHGVPPEMLKAQIQAVVEDIGVDAVKIGMLHSAVRVLVDELFGLACVITPNLDEAELFLNRKITGIDALETAASQLLSLGAQAVLLKGGHLQGNEVVDVMVQPGQATLRLASQRIDSRNVHGTGCTLSSAIAAHLAFGLDLAQAVTKARNYVLGAIAAGAGVHTGQGHGPLNHGYAPRPMQKLL